MSAIDGVDVTHPGGETHVALRVVALGQFRTTPAPGVTDRLDVGWTRNGSPQPALTGLFEFSLPSADATGSWIATVSYNTSQVRRDDDGLLTFSTSFSV